MKNGTSWTVFILDIFRNWNLPALILEAAESGDTTIKMNYLSSRKYRKYFNHLFLLMLFKKKSSRIFFMNHRTLEYVLSLKALNKSELKRSRVYISHFDNDFQLSSEFISAITQMERILTQNSTTKELLVGKNVNPDRIQVCIGAIDRKIFFPSRSFDQKEIYVAIAGDCKPRKNPSKIFELIKKNPELNFIIHGRGWEIFFHKMNLVPSNVEIVDFNYFNHPEFLRKASVFLSLATTEGGPLTILESLACGTPVVATNIGIWPDIFTIDMGEKIELAADLDVISLAIRRQIKRKEFVFDKDLIQDKYRFSDLHDMFYK